MLTSVNSIGASNAGSATIAAVKPAEAVASAKSLPVKTELGKKATPTITELDAKAFLQRQQIGAALYDRSFTLGEGVRAMQRQSAISAYATSIYAKEGGPTEKELRVLDRKLDRAEGQITRLSNNGRGADLDSLAAVDGRDLDIVQENLANRIKAGLKDGSLTKEEGDVLVARQQEINDVEAKLRESDGKLTGGEQKQLLDQLRKTAAEINKARNNAVGVNVTQKSYSDGIDNRQASLEKQLAAGIKSGALTEQEAETVRAEFATAAKLEDELRADGRVDWKDSVKMSTALNEAEIALYDLQRNTAGTQLKDVFVDVKHVDMREAAQLESLANGISNKALTDAESIELLESQKNIQSAEDKFLKDDGALDRGEYLRLQSQMNDFSLRNSELQGNKDRWTSVVSTTPPASGGSTAGSGGSTAGSGGSTAGSGGSTAGSGGSTAGSGGSTAGSGGSTAGSGGSTAGSGGSTAGSGGSTAGSGGSTAGSGGSTAGSGGSTAGSGGSTPAPTPVTPVVVDDTSVAPAPAAAAPAAPVAAAPEAPVAAEPEKVDVKPAPKRDMIADRFGEFMTGMMKQVSDQASELHRSFSEEARERAEERAAEKADNDRHDSRKMDKKDDGKPVHADVFRSFDSYGKVKIASERPNTGAWSKVA